MQVLIVADGVAPYAVGGIQKYSAMLAIWLARVGVPVCLVHAVDDDSKVPAAERLEGFPEDVREAIRSIVIVRPTAGRLPGHYVRDSLKLSERMLAAYTEAGIRSDLIAAQGQTGRAFIRARKRGVALPPVAIHAHGYEMFQSPQGLRGRLEQWLLRPTFARLSKEADFVFSFGGQIRKIVRGLGVPEQRILSARNGIEPEWLLEKPLESDAQKRRFLFVGRYERRKGVEAIHAAIEKIPVSRTEFRFIGPIPPKKRLKRSDVCYDGLVRDSVQLRSIYDTCDILLCPSYSEGMPTVILEAMARGLAVIATDVGAVAEIVSDQNGILLPEVGVGALHEAIETAINWTDEELASKQSASLEHCRKYTWEAVAKETLRSFEQIL